MLWFILACGESKNEEIEEETFNEGPTIELTVLDERPIDTAPLSIQVDVADPDGVSQLIGYYRSSDSSYWNQVLLWEGTSSDTEQSLELEIPVLWAPGTEIYVKATDAANPAAYRFYPERGPDEPILVSVYPESLSLPYTQDFEGGDLLSLNWWSPSEGRDSFAFFRNTSNGNNEGASAYHPAGNSGIEEVRDWLISPPIDFSQEEGVMVGWWEDVRSGSADSSHSLWVSTDQRLPDAGTYVEVQSLDVPLESGWKRYRYVDLSDWAGEPMVYLGWKWIGTLADEWYIDDIEVRSLGPDLEVSITPQVSPIVIGATVPALIQITNHTNAQANNIELAFAFPDGGASYDGEPIVIESLAENAQTEFEVSLTLDENLEPNRYLSTVLDVQADEGDWSLETSLLIGYPSLLSFSVEASQPSFVQVEVGVGDPEAPTWMTSEYLVVEGQEEIEVEVTDAYMYLPPAAGENRWFVHLESDTLLSATDVSLSYGNQSYIDPYTPSLTLFSGVRETVLIPPPPEPVLSSSPNSASPGEILPLSLTMYNSGYETQGPVYASITATSSGVSVIDGENVVLDSDVWGYYEFRTLTGPTVQIDETHVSSQPVQLEILLSDDVESWVIPFDIAVPFPVLQVTGIQVLDDDGILSADENAPLSISIANVGDMNAFGPVTAELSVVSAPSTVSVSNSNPSFGFVNAGASKDDDDFAITVEGGTAGDSIILQLDCTDTENTYTDQFELVLGEAPWYSLSSIPDDVGDVDGDSSIDLYAVDVRSFDGRFEMRIESATEIDAAIAFLEIWGSSGGADYTYYRWVMQSGTGTMQGYNSGEGFQSIGTLDITFLDTHRVVLGWDIADMGLSQDQFSLGIAAGWCGPPDYYCDQYPNGWGYPYESFSASTWFDVSF